MAEDKFITDSPISEPDSLRDKTDRVGELGRKIKLLEVVRRDITVVEFRDFDSDSLHTDSVLGSIGEWADSCLTREQKYGVKALILGCISLNHAKAIAELEKMLK